MAGPLLNLETHEFEVRAVSPFVTIDGEPIVDETPASYEWDVQVPPEPPEFDTRITSMPPAVAIGGPDAISTFTFESDPPGNIASFECSLDGEPFDDCELPGELRGPARRRAHLPGPRGRPVREPGPEPGHATRG